MLVERAAHVVVFELDVAFAFDEVVRVDERVGVLVRLLPLLLIALQAQLQPLLLGVSAFELFGRVAVVAVVAFVRVKRAALPLVGVRGPIG